MRIFYAFLVVLTSVILFLLPLTGAVYDYRTDVRTDTFSTETGAGVTSANVTLLKNLYDDDVATVDILSDEDTDIPLADSYNSTPRLLLVTGLAASENRTLEVSYDIDALTAFPSINTLLDRVPFIWMLIVICFAPAAIFAIFTGRS